MKYNISNLIKTYRKKKGITQSELARGICTQAIISKIENSETTPSMEIFFLLCERLEIPTNEILKVLEFDLATEKKEYFFSEEFQEIYYKRDYHTLNNIIKNLIIYDELNSEEKIYYKWIQIISEFYLYNHKEKAVKKLESMINEGIKNLKLYDRIIQSLAIMYYDINNLKKSLELLLQIEDNILTSNSVKFKITGLYYLSKNYRSKKNYSKSLDYNSKALDYLISQESMFYLGELLLEQAELMSLEGLRQEALQSCDRAISIFEITNKNFQKSQAFTFKNKITNIK